MTGRRIAAGLVAGTFLPFSVAVSAHADVINDLPTVTAAQRAASIGDLQPEVDDLDIADTITGLETSESDSSVTLSSDILFGFDTSSISDAAQTEIGKIVEDVPDGASVTITGYTDDVGEDDYNEKLATERAQAVEKVLARVRIDLDLTAEGRGAADPVAPNAKGGEDNPEGRAKNRRVEIVW